MITRPRSAAWLALVSASLVSILACQRVPLLAPSGSTISLTTTTNALPVNGTTQVVAQIIEPAGTPPQRGTHVTFLTTLGTIRPAETETNVNGQAIVMFDAGGASGTATITAISGGVSVGTTGGLKILIGTAAVGRVILNASPSLVPSLGGSSTISATVFDVNGNALVAAPVSFSTNAGTLTAALVTTDNAGAAQTVLTTSTTTTVTASVGAQGGSSTTPPPTDGGTTTPTTPSAGQASGTVTVGVAGAPTLVINPPSPAPTAGIAAIFSFVVTPSTTNGSAIRGVTVDWGDGSTNDLGALSGTASVAHTYRTAGTYSITAVITDSFGNRVSVTNAVLVNPTTVTLTITPPTTAPSAGLPAVFTIAIGTMPAGAAVRNVHLDWGDGSAQDLGSVSASTSVSHVYRSQGTYVVTGTLTDTAGNTISNSTSVTVIPVQRPTIIITPSPVPGKVNTQTNLRIEVTLPSGISVQNLAVDFGDGQRANLGGASTASVPHVYTTQGTFTVTVTVLDTSGQTTIGTTVVSIGP